jgi:hypothetical protein
MATFFSDDSLDVAPNVGRVVRLCRT